MIFGILAIILMIPVYIVILWAGKEVVAAIDSQTEVQKRIADAQERSADATEKLNKMIVNYYPGATGEE